MEIPEPELIRRLRKELQQHLDQLVGEAEKVRKALAALDPRGAPPKTPRRPSPRSGAPASTTRRPPAPRRRRRAAAGATKAKVLGALSSDKAMTAGEVAAATGLKRPSVSTMLSRLATTGEVVKAERGYQLPSGRTS